MKKLSAFFFVACLAVQPILYVSLSPISGSAQTTQPTSPTMAFGLLDGTPVKLKIGRTMSSADAKTGESVDFEVLEEVKIGDVIVVARGGTAIGTVTKAKRKGRMAKGGKLDINIDYVRLIDGEKVALRAVKEMKGGGHTGAMTGAIVATSIIFFPAAPFFLFMHGKDITIPKGTEITAYTNADVPLDPKNFTPQSVPVATPDQKPVADSSSSISIKSSPDGAEIEVDGKFVGSTPSTVQLQPGEHKITVKKAGFVVWERTITLNAGGSITVDATLEKNP